MKAVIPPHLVPLVTAVKAHALTNYEKDGWDYIVETYTDDQIADTIAGCVTVGTAITTMKKIAKLLDERRKEGEGTAW